MTKSPTVVIPSQNYVRHNQKKKKKRVGEFKRDLDLVGFLLELESISILHRTFHRDEDIKMDKGN